MVSIAKVIEYGHFGYTYRVEMLSELDGLKPVVACYDSQGVYLGDNANARLIKQKLHLSDYYTVHGATVQPNVGRKFDCWDTWYCWIFKKSRPQVYIFDAGYTPGLGQMGFAPSTKLEASLHGASLIYKEVRHSTMVSVKHDSVAICPVTGDEVPGVYIKYLISNKFGRVHSMGHKFMRYDFHNVVHSLPSCCGYAEICALTLDTFDCRP